MKRIFPFGGEASRVWAWLCRGTVRLGLGFILVGMACIHAVGQPGRIDLFSNGAANPVYGPDLFECYDTNLSTNNRIKLLDGYTAEAWIAKGTNVSEELLTPLLGSRTSFRRNGVFLKSGALELPNIYGGETFSIQIRAWRTSLFVTEWNLDVFQRSEVEFGKSDVVNCVAGGVNAQGVLQQPCSLVGKIPSFFLACVFPENIPADEDRDGDGVPDGYELGTMDRYVVYESLIDFESAQRRAGSLGGHLATVSMPSEMENLAKLLESDHWVGKRLWLGGIYDTNFNQWRWLTGEQALFDFWTGVPTPSEDAALALIKWNATNLFLTAMPPYMGADGFVLERGIRTSPDSADSDGDGSSDRIERLLGTFPMDPGSIPTLPLRGLPRIVLEAGVPVGLRYQIEYREGAEWRAFGEVKMGTGDLDHIVVPAGDAAEHAVWRVRILD